MSKYTLTLGTTTHMETTTTHIPNISTFGNKRTHATTQGQNFTLVAHQIPWVRPLQILFFQNTNQSPTSQGPTPTLQNLNEGPTFQFQNTLPSSQNKPNKYRRIHIVPQRVPNQNTNQGPTPSFQNSNQGPIFSNTNQGITPPL